MATESPTLWKTEVSTPGPRSSRFYNEGSIIILSAAETYLDDSSKDSTAHDVSLTKAPRMNAPSHNGHDNIEQKASISTGNNLKVRLQSGRIVPDWRQTSLRYGEESIDLMALSPNGNHLATGHVDGTLVLWDMNLMKVCSTLGNRLERRIGEDGRPVPIHWALVFSPDSSRLVSTESLEYRVRVWDIETRAEYRILPSRHKFQILHLDYSSNGGLIASGSADGTAQMWNAHTGELLRTFTVWPSGTAFMQVAFLHNDEVLATCTTEAGLLWSTTSEAKVSLKWHHDIWFMCGIRPSHARAQLATFAKYLMVHSWDADGKLTTQTESLDTTLKMHRDSVRCVAFSPNDNEIVSGSDDGQIIAWRPSQSVLTRFMHPYTATHYKVKINPTLSRYQLEGDPLPAIYALDYSPCGNLLASGSIDGDIRVWDARTRRCLATHTGHGAEEISGIMFMAGGRDILSWSEGSIIIWDISSFLTEARA